MASPNNALHKTVPKIDILSNTTIYMVSVVRAVARGVRESVTLANIGSLVVLALALRYVLDEPWADVAWFLALAVVVNGLFVLSDTLNVDGRHTSAVVGVGLIGLGIGAAAIGGSWVLGAAAVAFGVWIVLDAIAAVHAGRSLASDTGDTDEEPSPAEVLFEGQVLNLVTQALDEGPRTPTELASACDLTESRTRDALDRLESMDAVYVLDGAGDQRRWALDESELGVLAFFRETVTTVLSRALLPIRELAGRV